MNNSKNAAEKLIAFSIAKDKPGIVKILQRNGVRVTENDDPKRLSAAVIAGLRSQTFRRDLGSLLSKNALDNKAVFGQDVKFGAPGDRVVSTTTPPPDPTISKYVAPTTNSLTNLGGTGTKAPSQFSNFLSQTILKPDTVNQFISTGLNALNTSLASKREAAAQKTLQLQNDAAYYQSQNYNPNSGTGQPTVKAKLSTGAIIGLSAVGLIVVVGIGFLIVKQMNKKK